MDTKLQLRQEKTELGFWLYLMTDIMLFASLFATFYILRANTNGGASGMTLFDPTYALAETLILLASSVTGGIAFVSMRFSKERQALWLLAATIVLGVAFLMLELREFIQFASEGNSWTMSAFLSGFFTLVGTHGLHILVGLIWASTLFQAFVTKGSSQHLVRKFGLFTLFWHFLDVVWIFIFSVVYLIGGTS